MGGTSRSVNGTCSNAPDKLAETATIRRPRVKKNGCGTEEANGRRDKMKQMHSGQETQQTRRRRGGKNNSVRVCVKVERREFRCLGFRVQISGFHKKTRLMPVLGFQQAFKWSIAGRRRSSVFRCFQVFFRCSGVWVLKFLGFRGGETQRLREHCCLQLFLDLGAL